MNSVRDLLALKGGDVWAAAPEDTVYHALVLMSDKDIGSVLVTDGDQLVGIFTESDYVRKLVLHGKSPKRVRLSEVMSSPVHTIDLYSSIRECLNVMSDRKIRYVPVMDDDKVVGVISISDVMREVIYEQGAHIRFWEDLAIEL